MGARGLNVFVNIGAKLSPTLNSAANAVERRFSQMGRRIRVVGAEMKAALKGVEEAQSRRRTAMLEGIGAGYLGYRMIQPFVGFEDALVRMGDLVDVTGPKLDRIGKSIIASGARYGIGGRAAIVGASDYLAAGLTMNQAMGALEPTLKLAKAANVEVGEAAQAGTSLMRNLGVEALKVGDAFDIVARAGKLGSFEVADMSRAFPSLTAMASQLGMKGTDGVARLSAMLQVTRTNAADAEEAANNLVNVFQKLTGKETVRNFAKAGVDLEKIMAQSKKRGTNYVDDILDELDRLGARDPFKLNELFADRQANQGITALLRNRKMLDDIRQKSLGGRGTLDTTIGRLSKTSKFGLDRASAGLERISIALGRAFGPALGDAAEMFAGFAERFAAWADKNPQWVKGIGAVVGGLIALRTAGAGLGFLLGGRFMTTFRLFGGKLLGVVARSFTRLAGWIVAEGGVLLLNGLVRLAPLLLRGLGIAFGVLSGPVGWAILAASALALAWTYRDNIAEGWKIVTTWFTDTAWPAVRDTVLSINWGAIGMTIADQLTGGLASKLPNMLSSIHRTLNTPIVDFLPKGLGGSGPVNIKPVPFGATPPKVLGRALGGSISAARAYVVGERGPELVTPSRGGYVHTAAATRRMMGGGGGVVNNNHFHIQGSEPHAISREVEAVLRRLAHRQDALLSD